MPVSVRKAGLLLAVVLLGAGLMALPGLAPPADTPPAMAAPDVLGSLRQGHPRLYALDPDWKRIREAVERSSPVRDWYQVLQAQAGRMLEEPPVEHKLVGPRLLSQSRRALERISTLAGLYRLDGDRRKAQRARLEMLTAAAFPDWNPAHFLDTAEMTNALAIGYDWLFDFLSPQERATIGRAIVEKGLKEGMRVFEKGGWWTTSRNNWNQVCNGGLTAGALAIADQEPELARQIMERGRQSIVPAMRSFAPDGGDEEGPGYWNYATRYNVYYLSALQTALDTDFGLAATPGFAEAGMFRIHSTGPLGLTFNYADAGEWAGTAAQMFWLARQFRRPLYARHEAQMVAHLRPEIFHLVWGLAPAASPAQAEPRLPSAAEPELPRDAVFRGVEVAFFRSGWEETNAVYVGFKGGDNKANHSHLDLGTFVLDALGQRWAADLGPDDYNLPAYFGKLRWTYYRLRTEGHNTLTVDGQNQVATARAPLVAFLSTPARAFAVADLTAAYQPKVQRALRGVALLARRQVLVEDEVQAVEPVEVVWAFHTRAAVDLAGKRAMLSRGQARLEARLLSPEEARFAVTSAGGPPPQAQQPQVQKLVVWLPGKVSRLRLAVLLAPAGSASPPALEPLDAWIAAARLK